MLLLFLYPAFVNCYDWRPSIKFEINLTNSFVYRQQKNPLHYSNPIKSVREYQAVLYLASFKTTRAAWYA